MARKERISKGRTMLPNFFVFCEGDTVKYTDTSEPEGYIRLETSLSHWVVKHSFAIIKDLCKFS